MLRFSNLFPLLIAYFINSSILHGQVSTNLFKSKQPWVCTTNVLFSTVFYDVNECSKRSINKSFTSFTQKWLNGSICAYFRDHSGVFIVFHMFPHKEQFYSNTKENVVIALLSCQILVQIFTLSFIIWLFFSTQSQVRFNISFFFPIKFKIILPLLK